MKSRAEKIREFILNKIRKHPNDIVAVVSDKFSVSRTTAHRHLNTLIKQNKIIKTGVTNKVIYTTPESKNKVLDLKINSDLEEDRVWSKYFKEEFLKLPKNIYDICNYGFTEILNNAIDHSEGTYVRIESKQINNCIELNIIDNGIGLFKKIKNAFKFENERECAMHLSKGKLTTDPENHTGEGIFFTSRSSDEFTILANGLFFMRVEKEDDWFLEKRDNIKDNMTNISMKINLKSKRQLHDVFSRYTNPETDKFDKTHIHVELSKLGDEEYISRSQAKRIIFGLDKFSEIILDFKGVRTVGQGFVDQIFRIFKNDHPEIKIEYINANEDVEFMIKRSIS